MDCFVKQKRGRKEREGGEKERKEGREEKKAEGRKKVNRILLFHDSDYLCKVKLVLSCSVMSNSCHPMDCNLPGP